MILLLLGLLLTVIALPVSNKTDSSSTEGKNSPLFTDTSYEEQTAQRSLLEEKLDQNRSADHRSHLHTVPHKAAADPQGQAKQEQEAGIAV